MHDTDAPCESCDCCPAALCTTARAEGTACLVLAPARPRADDAVVRCPCAPAWCQCEPPGHLRGIARCRHGRRRMAQQSAGHAAAVDHGRRAP